MASRSSISTGDAQTPLAALYDIPSPPIDAFTAMAERAARAIAAGLPHVQPGFLQGAALHEARQCVAAASTLLPPPPGLQRVAAAIDSLRSALALACGRELLPSAELSVLAYKAGGSYRRHLDDRPGITLGGASVSAPGTSRVRRSLSLVLFLTPDDWVVDDGGALRCHAHPGMAQPCTLDVPPMPGTLVIFDSATVPHEVLVTRRERTVLAGWLQEAVG